MSRTESSSSINIYKQCPRKYYFAYKLKLPMKESIATIAGNVVHDTLEAFFKIDLAGINKQKFEVELEHFLYREFHQRWTAAVPRLLKIANNRDKILEYYEDSQSMLNNFLRKFCEDMRKELSRLEFEQAFEELRPKTEVYILSNKYNIQGYIDALYIHDDEITIVDYKTSKKDDVTEQYHLQLAIYALLAHEKYKKLPKKISLFFLRHGTEKEVAISEELLKIAEKEATLIHQCTVSDHADDYPKTPNNLCSWCDFYETCFGQQKLDNY